MELPALQVRPADVARSVLEGYGAVQNIRANNQALESGGIDLEQKRAVQAAQQRYQQGDQSALNDMMVLDPSNAARLAQGQAALRSDRQVQMENGYKLASRAAETLQAAEPQQRPALWKAYRGFAEQQGLPVAPELQGEYSEDKLNYLNQQIQMVKPMLAESFQGFEGTGFEQQFANQLAKDLIARGMEPRQALLVAADKVNQSRMTWTTDEKGNQVARPGASSIMGNGFGANGGAGTPAPYVPPVQQPSNQPALNPVTSLTPTPFIDQGEGAVRMPDGTLMATGTNVDLGTVPIPDKPIVMPLSPAEPVKTAAEIAAEKYPNNPSAQQKFIEAEAAKAGSGEKTEVEVQDKARERLDQLLSTAAQYYQELDKLGGLKRTSDSGIVSAVKSLKNSQGFSLPDIAGGGTIIPGGQDIQSFVATPQAEVLDKLAALKPLITSELKNALGKKSGEMNSNQELQTFLKALDRPNSTIGANTAILQNISKLYGKGNVASIGSGTDIPVINSPSDATFGALAKGAKFKTPDGQIRIKK